MFPYSCPNKEKKTYLGIGPEKDSLSCNSEIYH